MKKFPLFIELYRQSTTFKVYIPQMGALIQEGLTRFLTKLLNKCRRVAEQNIKH
ncbi:hypothetical protein JYA63_15715 [Fictibacillus nanhaiensis]|uniref:Uncharacterized protein n=1 Tax=Fictibacillus nanhaiensis TaxID=742169 RepID=A0ABS2ZWT6_9BACL|nr:hypothetical protein [Fictibacillus nanhaiensis]